MSSDNTTDDASGEGPASGELDLSGFRRPPVDHGMSLEQLSSAFAELLEQGDDPYERSTDQGPESDKGAVADRLGADTGVGGAEACEVTPKSIFEAMLFVGRPDGSPLTASSVAALMRGVRPAEIEAIVNELNEVYTAEGCPYEIIGKGDGYRMRLRAQFAHVPKLVQRSTKERRLSAAALEVLSIVAYQGNATAEAINRLRGRPSAAVLHQLVRRQLLHLDRDAAHPRRSLYRVTDRFLALFGLNSLDDLPKNSDLDGI